MNGEVLEKRGSEIASYFSSGHLFGCSCASGRLFGAASAHPSHTNSPVGWKDSSCCGCFPIKCGVLAIGIFTLLLTIYMVTMNFFLILNEYIHWYFPVVIIVLLAPMCIGSSFFVVFFTKDTASSRGKLFTACMFGIISTALIAVWVVCYYVFIYKNDTVFSGQGDPQTNSYTKMSKKFYLFVVLAETTALCIAYSYFICVTNRYADNMKGKDEEEAKEEMMAAAEEKPAAAEGDMAAAE